MFVSEVLADGSVRLGEEARRAGYTPGTLVEVIVSSARGTLILALHDASPTTVDGAAVALLPDPRGRNGRRILAR